jgi:hypothetical protein
MYNVQAKIQEISSCISHDYSSVNRLVEQIEATSLSLVYSDHLRSALQFLESHEMLLLAGLDKEKEADTYMISERLKKLMCVVEDSRHSARLVPGIAPTKRYD